MNEKIRGRGKRGEGEGRGKGKGEREKERGRGSEDRVGGIKGKGQNGPGHRARSLNLYKGSVGESKSR